MDANPLQPIEENLETSLTKRVAEHKAQQCSADTGQGMVHQLIHLQQVRYKVDWIDGYQGMK